MAIVQVTIVPLGTGSTSVSDYVASVERVLSEAPESIKHQLTPMSTIIEGELDDILAVIRRMHEVPFREGAKRVSTSITIDDRRDKVGTMAQKMDSVAEKLKDQHERT
ncbi:MTH1187 family thiamine-binding protein [Cohnella nanjingensis]|uniref:MTH1187 family thiamine-binding protein n=1 Tax=Cohnella nanjingensis TaxID=1387779 RepID=A0A7X0RN54_9BACL|nr:MTH1187 family thiamine-binding protein [Cohnella nanjingensis]MBB6669285.1 MTH1187 family thiamine-binding protein [Cohnella nanjingensis]